MLDAAHQEKGHSQESWQREQQRIVDQMTKAVEELRARLQVRALFSKYSLGDGRRNSFVGYRESTRCPHSLEVDAGAF